VSVVDSEKKRSDEYWMGVRDALRMVDSFTKWARRNESRAKNLDDFIHDGLVAAAKRCESCLKDDLGLTFAEEELASAGITEPETIPSGYEMDSTPRDPSDIERTYEITPEDMSPDASEVPIESESDGISIDTVGRLEEEEMDDLSIEGPPREFTSDFDLIEPTELSIEQPSAEVETTPEPEPEVVSEESSESDTKPSFTWADYEKAITPSTTDPEPDEEDVELPPPFEEESVEEDLPGTEEIPEPPSIPSDDLESDPPEEEVSETADEPEPITEPPAPPPPPESDEDEEERRRRARRLFFGD
jgi:hypothetical protein